jgi:pimeloyl-ACP methyl ester carboxylesterase
MSNGPVIDQSADARFAVLVLAVEDLYRDPVVLEPAVTDPRITTEWNVEGYITGTDAVAEFGHIRLGAREVFYGLVLKSKTAPGEYVVAIRGTNGAIEWAEDFAGLPRVDARFPGLVETGFSEIADTFLYRQPGYALPMDLIPAIVSLGDLRRVTVAGHSLGSALGTLLAHELAKALPGLVSLRIWASPHTGNGQFVASVAQQVPDHVHYRNVNDIVPRVPIMLGYTHLPNTVNLAASTDELEIKPDWACSHHLLSYTMTREDARYVNCIIWKKDPANTVVPST